MSVVGSCFSSGTASPMTLLHTRAAGKCGKGSDSQTAPAMISHKAMVCCFFGWEWDTLSYIYVRGRLFVHWLSLCLQSLSLYCLCFFQANLMLPSVYTSADGECWGTHILQINEDKCPSEESQNGRGWKWPLWIIQSNSPAEAGSPRAGYTGPHPGGLWISPGKENSQRLWETCSSAPSPSEWRRSSSCSDGTSYATVCACCPLSCRWAPLKRAWPHPPDTHAEDVYKHLLGPISAFSSSGWTSPAPSAFPRRRDAPVPLPSS